MTIKAIARRRALTFGWSLFLLLNVSSALGQVPNIINYQGRVQVGNTSFSGIGQFKFALVQGAGPNLLWKNDGSVGNTEPATAVTLNVANGLVSTMLGDTGVVNMAAMPASIFSSADVRLRVWFNGGSGFQQLTPDQRIVSVGYAIMAGGVPDGSITAEKLAPGAVNSAQLADALALGTSSQTGSLDIFRTAANTAAISLVGSLSRISTFGSDGLEQIRLHGASYGEILLHDKIDNTRTVRLSSGDETEGVLRLLDAPPEGGSLLLTSKNGVNGASLSASAGGNLTLYQADGAAGAVLDGDYSGYGRLELRSTSGSTRARLNGGPNAGSLSLFESDGTETVNLGSQGAGSMILRQGDTTTGLSLTADNGTGGGGISLYRNNGTFAGQLTVSSTTTTDGWFSLARSGTASLGLLARGGGNQGGGMLELYQSDDTKTIGIYTTESGAGGGQMLFYNGAGDINTVQIDGEIGVGGGGYIGLRDNAGVETIVLNADSGTATAKVIEITGGADLSENFNVNSPNVELLPGMIASIDPKNPGELMVSSIAYDKRVAGVISGAGGVQPGFKMGQRGSVADGKHPIALTGRVYCYVDADAGGAVEPGDLLTTSGTPGHGMKVNDHSRAGGAVIGKAMTHLAKGRGLVLVLVNLQ